jgi:hypothetical protein
MDLTFRAARLEDFEAIYACCYSTFGYSDVFKAEVRWEWETFRQNANALTVVVEDLNRQTEEGIVGYAEAVFISDAFAVAAKTGQRPFLNKQIAELARKGCSPLLEMAGIRKAQFGEGVTLYIAFLGWREAFLDPENAWKVRDYTNHALNKLGLGYFYREVMIEVAGESPKNRGLDAGFYLRTDYAPYYKGAGGLADRAPEISLPAPEFHPYLLSLMREEAFRRDGSLLSQTFVYSKPQFGFKPHEQELLCWALQGRSDEQIASCVHVSPVAIKKRWDTLYTRVEASRPSLLPTSGAGKRGPEKRGLLLAYLRDHPEELRPCIVPLCGYGRPLEENI